MDGRVFLSRRQIPDHGIALRSNDGVVLDGERGKRGCMSSCGHLECMHLSFGCVRPNNGALHSHDHCYCRDIPGSDIAMQKPHLECCMCGQRKLKNPISY